MTTTWAIMSGPQSYIADAPLAIVVDEQNTEITRDRADTVWLADEMMMHAADAKLNRMGYRRAGDWVHRTTLTWVTEVQAV